MSSPIQLYVLQNVSKSFSLHHAIVYCCVKIWVCRKGLTCVYIPFQHSPRPAYPRILRSRVVGRKLNRGLGFPVLPLPGYRGFTAQIRPEREAETTALTGLSSEEGPHQPVSRSEIDKFKFAYLNHGFTGISFLL